MRQALISIPIVKFSAQIVRSVARVVLPGPTRLLLRQRLISGNSIGSLSSITQPESCSTLSPSEVGMFTTFDEVTFKIDKARRILGYEPSIDFAEGMRHTAAWIQWARL